jgi:ABC-type Zn uptake system ZnuABC Zn-binding protein ZnuA
MARIPFRLGDGMNSVVSKYALLLAAAAFLTASLISPGTASAKKLNVVTATTDLAALAQEVGGDRITVESIAKGYQDPHFVEAKPSFLLKLRQADLLIVVGLQLEIGWLPPLITQSGNSRIQVGANGYLDASQFAEILEIPQGSITRAMGDVHPLGNPHYWLDPDNGRRVAKGIAAKLGAALSGLRSPPDGGGQKMADGYEAVSRAEGSHLSQLVAEFCQTFRAGRGRFRGAAAGNSAYPEPYL